jgi:hypothetical protein
MKIALLEISHWHFPLYIEDLLSCGAEIIAISDKNEKIRNKVPGQPCASVLHEP